VEGVLRRLLLAIGILIMTLSGIARRLPVSFLTSLAAEGLALVVGLVD